MAASGSIRDQQAQSIVRSPGEGRDIPLGVAGVVTLKAVGDETGGTLSVYEFIMPPRTAGPPLHLHGNMDEVFYVLEGESTFLVDGETKTAPAGSFVFIPRGIAHTFWNESELPVKQLTVFTPAGIEDYFDEVTQVLAAPGEDTLGAAAAMMEKHDMVVPPENGQAYGALAPADLTDS